MIDRLDQGLPADELLGREGRNETADMWYGRSFRTHNMALEVIKSINEKIETVDELKKELNIYRYNFTEGIRPADRNAHYTNDIDQLEMLGGGNKDYWNKNTKMLYGA